MSFEKWLERYQYVSGRLLTENKHLRDAYEGGQWDEREECASKAYQIIDGILEDLTDRRGLRQEWEQIDLATQMEIINAWKDIVVNAIKGADSHE